MRISDWSSDVCSSDLDDRAETAHFAVEQTDGVAVAVVAAKAVRADHPGERVALMRRSHFAAPAHFGQAPAIARLGGSGRASCRGRVCQYVSISVVAVTYTQTERPIEQ